MAYPVLLDLNKYEEVNDWTLEGTDGVILKTSENNLVDKAFPNYWRALKATNKVRGTYNYFRPTYDLYTQLSVYSTMARNTPLPPVGDIELYNAYSDDVSFYTNSSQSKVRSTILDYLKMMEDLFGREPMIYTSAGFWNKYVGEVDWAKNYLLWVASWGGTKPTIPIGWTEWKFWQYTSHGVIPGIVGDVDMNYFNGTLVELKLLANVEATVPPPPPPPHEPRPEIHILVNQLRIRTAPNINSNIVGYLPGGIDIDYLDTYKSGNDIWYQIGYLQWCAGLYNGYKYSDIVPSI